MGTYIGSHIYRPVVRPFKVRKSITNNPRFQSKRYNILIPHLPELVPGSPDLARRLDLVPDIRFPVLDSDPKVLLRGPRLLCVASRWIALANGLLFDQLDRRISPAGLRIIFVAHTDQSISVFLCQARGPFLSGPQCCLSGHRTRVLRWIKTRSTVTMGFSRPSALCSSHAYRSWWS